MPSERGSQRGIFSIIIKTENVKATQLRETGSVVATPFKKKQKVYTVYLFITPKAINLCTQKKSLHEKSVKIGKNLIVKLKIGRAKEAIKNLTIRFTAKD